MTDSTPTRTTDTSLGRDVLDVARYYLGGRRGFFILAAIAVVTGLVFNWSWLVAAGIAPVLVAALPCVAMCALGLCMHRIGGRSCSTDTAAAPTSQGSGADDMPTPALEIPPVGPTANGAGDPEAAVVMPAPAIIKQTPQHDKELTNA